MSRSHPAHTVAELSEEELLAVLLPILQEQAGGRDRVLLGPGDDAAVVGLSESRIVVTTDAMMRDVDWRDDWSTGEEVGRKLVAQNLADVAAMGAVPAGLVVSLIAAPDTSVAWLEDLASGIGAAAGAQECPVVGGDLGSAPLPTVVLSVTAFGDLEGRAAVTRAGARPGDVVAVAGTLGRSGAGLELLSSGRAGLDTSSASRTVPVAAEPLVRAHRAPEPPYAAGPAAAVAGVHAMLDVSDGLSRDAHRMALASGVCVALRRESLREDVAAIAPVLGEETAWRVVLTGGEEHSLLAAFPAGTALPASFRAIGEVLPAAATGPDVVLDGVVLPPRGWDHFHG